MEFRILGPVEVEGVGEALAPGGRRERALLAALILGAGDVVSTDRLVAALWGDDPPRSAAKTLQNHVLRLRKVLGPELIETRPPGYRLLAGRDAVDARRFEALLGVARDSIIDGAPASAAATLREALQLWRGLPFEELAGYAPAEAEAARLSELRRVASEELMEADLACGRHVACVAELESMVAAEPLRERRWAMLMLALYRCGRQADALRAYQRARTTLADELGVEPGPELGALERSVLAHDAALVVHPTPVMAQDALPTGVVTFVLSDIEGSTRRWEANPVAMAATVARHDEIFTYEVGAAGGILLKARGEGDSTLSVFTRTTDAVAAALAVHRAVLSEPWPEGLELSVRMAIHTGEAFERDGDYYGPTVNRAARIRALAFGGQVLISETAAGVIRDDLPDGADLVELGEQPLRDLTRPERVFGLVASGRDPGPGARVVARACPYMGLLAFQPEDHALFFGRDEVVRDLVARLARTGLVAVVGASGSGKSSVLRAGMIPAMAAAGDDGRAAWPTVVMTPGTRPLAELATHVSRAGGVPAGSLLESLKRDPTALDLAARQALLEERLEAKLLVVVDQFEELFTACRDRSARESFVAALLDAVDAGRTAVAIALRADFFGQCAGYPALAKALERDTVLLGPMDEDGLRAAVERPARAGGLTVEAGLTEVVLRDVAGEPGGLPLLSHALRETWKRRRGQSLTVAGYRDSGGVRGAISRTAEAVYESLGPGQQAVARDVFLRLTELGEGSADTRRQVPLDEVLSRAPEAPDVLRTLTDARLVTAADGTVEVAHEALIREWPRLRGWVDEDRERLRVMRHLATAAHEWQRLGREPAELYGGPRLAAAVESVGPSTGAQLSPLEREFLDASRRLQEVEVRHAQTAVRRLRALLAGTAFALVVALVAGTLAVVQRSRAGHQAVVADAARLAAQSRLFPPDRLDLALLLGVAGHRLDPSIATEGGLEAALGRVPPGLDRLVPVDRISGYPGLSNDHRLIAAPHSDGTVRLIDVRSGRVLRTLRGAGAPPLLRLALFSSDDRWVAAGSNQGTVAIWDVGSGAQVGPPLRAGDGPVNGVFDPADPTRFFTVSTTAVIRWDIHDHRHAVPVGEPLSFPAEPSSLSVMQVSPDGRRVAVAGYTNARTYVWDATSGAVLSSSLAGLPGGFTRDGRLLAVARHDRVVLVDPATGIEQGEALTGFTDANGAMAFSPDGRRLAVGDVADGSIRVFDLDARRQIGRSLVHFAASAFPSFLDNERLLVSSETELVVWRFGETAPVLATVLPRPAGGVSALGFASRGAEVVTTGVDDHRVLRWRARDGAPLGRLLDDRVAPGATLAVSPDGSTVLTQRSDGRLAIFDARTGQARSVIDPGLAVQSTTVWAPTGLALATAAPDGSVAVWDVADPDHPKVQGRLHIDAIAGSNTPYLPFPVFSPDGHLLVVKADTQPATLAFVDVARHRLLRVVRPGFSFGDTVFSPDGRTLAVAGNAPDFPGVVMLLDPKTGKTRAALSLPTFGFGAAFLQGGRRLVTIQVTSIATVQGSISTTTGLRPGTPVGSFTLDLWETATLRHVGEPLIVPDAQARSSTVGGADIAGPDGTRLLTSSNSGVASVWDFDPQRWEVTACRLAGRNLTRAEWAQYLPGRAYHAPCAQWR